MPDYYDAFDTRWGTTVRVTTLSGSRFLYECEDCPEDAATPATYEILVLGDEEGASTCLCESCLRKRIEF